jgi:hypothetical protein
MEPRTDGAKRVESPNAPFKRELALWRAFLGDEFDSILFDKD